MNSSPRIRSQRSQMIQTVLLSVYSMVLFGMHFIRIWATTATPIISRRSFLMASFCFWPVLSSADGSG